MDIVKIRMDLNPKKILNIKYYIRVGLALNLSRIRKCVIEDIQSFGFI